MAPRKVNVALAAPLVLAAADPDFPPSDSPPVADSLLLCSILVTRPDIQHQHSLTQGCPRCIHLLLQHSVYHLQSMGPAFRSLCSSSGGLDTGPSHCWAHRSKSEPSTRRPQQLHVLLLLQRPLRSRETQGTVGERPWRLHEFGFLVLFIKEQWAPCQLWGWGVRAGERERKANSCFEL